MASLIISYFGKTEGGAVGTTLGSETVTTSGTSAQSEINSKGAAVAFLHSSAAHWVTVGTDPTATSTNGFYLPANVLVPYDLDGITSKFAAITA